MKRKQSLHRASLLHKSLDEDSSDPVSGPCSNHTSTTFLSSLSLSRHDSVSSHVRRTSSSLLLNSLHRRDFLKLDNDDDTIMHMTSATQHTGRKVDIDLGLLLNRNDSKKITKPFQVGTRKDGKNALNNADLDDEICSVDSFASDNSIDNNAVPPAAGSTTVRKKSTKLKDTAEENKPSFVVHDTIWVPSYETTDGRCVMHLELNICPVK